MKADKEAGKGEYGGLPAVRCSVSPGERTQDREGLPSGMKRLCVHFRPEEGSYGESQSRHGVNL